MNRSRLSLALSCALLLFALPSATAQETADPFAALASLRGTPVLVPPRALAVIPERHTGRPLRVVDTLARVEPQFPEYARAAGLTPQRAIQLRTREANLSFFVQKTESTVSTVLQLELGASIEARGVLVERGGNYLFLASEVRSVAARRAP
jgi:hypothetical protein